VFEKRATGYNIGALGICLSFLILATATVAVPRLATPAQQAAATPTTAQRALLDQYCVTCHNQQLKTAGLTLDRADLNDMGGNDAAAGTS
jgi:cytochrome c5